MDSDFVISSFDDFMNDIDNDLIDTILNEHGSSSNFGETLEKFNNVYMDTVEACNHDDLSTGDKEAEEFTPFNATENEIVSVIEESLDDIDRSFNPYNVGTLPLTACVTKLKQTNMVNTSIVSKTSQPKLKTLKKEKKRRKDVSNSLKYRDLSMMTDEQARLNFKSMVGRSQDSFPVKLHKIIDQVERDGLSSIVSWCSHGRAFRIHDNNLFEKEVISRYFYQTRLTSFTRQLGM